MPFIPQPPSSYGFGSESLQGKQFAVFPSEDGRILVIESLVSRARLDTGEELMPFNDRQFYLRNKPDKYSADVGDTVLHFFSDMRTFLRWITEKVTPLWPQCGYCHVKYEGEEVVCKRCGGPRGGYPSLADLEGEKEW